MLIGPLVGGLLSRKNDEKPLIPSYPYAAPNIVVAAVYAIAIIGVIFGLEETLESLRHTEGSFMWKKLKALVGRGESNDHAYKAVGSEEPDALHSPIMELSHSNPGSPMTPQAPEQPKKKKGRLPFWRIWTFNVCCTMLAHFIIAGHLGTFANLWPIFLSSPVANPSQQHPPFKFNGGLGMQPSDVGYAMSLLGVIGVILQVMIYPMLNDRFGTVSIWRAALYIFPIVYIAAPFPALVASALDLAGRTLLTWIALCLILFLFVIGRTGVTPATTLLINDCTPHPSVRGTIHTAGTVIANLSRSIFPVIAFTVFGKGLEIGVVGLGFWVVAVLALLACVASQWVREGGNGTEIVLEGDEEEENGNAGPSHTNGQVRNRID
ncbi:MAG: hypothetical protein MMC33_003084 [Icmadophila ericetorum]|nr:hypothetical protein [Icmadophila ericetorum]